MLGDIQRGQVSQSPEGAFELGRNLAVTPGKVIHETRLYQLIQYSPATDQVLETPLVIFPPWINRFYILDLTPEKSFVKWTVDQGVTLFMVSWKSADETIRDISQDDYIAAQLEAIARDPRPARGQGGPHHRLLRRRDHACREPGLSRGQKRRQAGGVGDLLHRPGRL